MTSSVLTQEKQYCILINCFHCSVIFMLHVQIIELVDTEGSSKELFETAFLWHWCVFYTLYSVCFWPSDVTLHIVATTLLRIQSETKCPIGAQALGNHLWGLTIQVEFIFTMCKVQMVVGHKYTSHFSPPFSFFYEVNHGSVQLNYL